MKTFLSRMMLALLAAASIGVFAINPDSAGADGVPVQTLSFDDAAVADADPASLDGGADVILTGRRKAKRRDYSETLSEGINRRSGKREVEFRVHAGKRNKGLQAEGMDRWGLSELPAYGGRAPRPSVIQPDLDGRTGRRGGRRTRRMSYQSEQEYSDSCSY